MDGYIDTLETIYRRELLYHYSQVGFSAIEERVSNILGDTPRTMMSFSSMGFTEQYINFFTIFQLLGVFFKTIPTEYTHTLGITELDRKNNLYDIYSVIGSKSLGIGSEPDLIHKINNTGRDYESDIVVFRDPIRQAKEKFSAGVRNFLKLHRTQ